jgi:coenzyme Q-binding protein COQ10
MTTFVKRRLLPFTAVQLFDLVADVDRYPEFMPWVVHSRMRRSHDDTFDVDMTIAAGPIRKSFSTRGTLCRPRRIDITSNDPLFKWYRQSWIFEPLPAGGTNVECHLDFKLRSRLLQMLMAASLIDRTAATLGAFKDRARRLYSDQSQ